LAAARQDAFPSRQKGGVDATAQAPEPTLTDTFLDLDVDDGWAREMAASLALVPDGGASGAGLGAPSDADGSGGSHGTSRGTDSRSLTSSRGDLGGGCGGDGCVRAAWAHKVPVPL